MTNRGPASERHEPPVEAGVIVGLSEKDLGLGVPMMRALDKGLSSSSIRLVLVSIPT